MRTLRIVLLLVSPALTGGAMLAAQAVERTDVPARGVLRVTFDPRIMTWNDEFTDAGRLKLGAPLTGDTVGGRYIPVVARLEQNVRVASGLDQQAAGCALPPSPCAARDSSARWRGVRDALHGAVYGAGQTGSPFLPLDTSTAGRAIDSAVAQIRQGLNLTFRIGGFDTTVALAQDTLSGAAFEQILLSPDPNGFGYVSVPFHRNFRYRLGDVELAAKYRLVDGAHYAAALQAGVRLPTGAKDSANELLIQSIGH